MAWSIPALNLLPLGGDSPEAGVAALLRRHFAMQGDPKSSSSHPSRRTFLGTTGGTVAALIGARGLVDAESAAAQEGSPAPNADDPNIEGAVPVALRINGRD